MGISQKEYAEAEAEAGMLQMNSHIHIMTMVYVYKITTEREITKQTNKQGNCVPSKNKNKVIAKK